MHKLKLVVLLAVPAFCCGRVDTASATSEMSLTDSTLQSCTGSQSCPDGLQCTYFELPAGRERLCVKPGSECDVVSCSNGGRCGAFLTDPPFWACSSEPR